MSLLGIRSSPFDCLTFDTTVLDVSETTRRVLRGVVGNQGWYFEAHLPLLERCIEEMPSDTELKVLIAAIRRDGHVYARWI